MSYRAQTDPAGRTRPRRSRRPVLLATLAAAWLGTSMLPVEAQDSSAPQPPLKIAVVDLEAVASASPAGLALQKELADFEAAVQAEGKGKTDRALELQGLIRDGANSLTPEKLSEYQRELEDLTIQLQRFQDDKQREGQQMQAEGLRKVEAELEPVFKALQEQEGYDLILNKVPGVVVIAGDRADITQLVIDRLTAAGG